MKVEQLQKIAKIVDKVSNRGSITQLYRCVELGPQSIRCCSEYGNCEAWIDIPEIQQKCLINAGAYLAVVNSLDPQSDLSLELKGDRILWKSGAAKGHLTLVPPDNLVPLITYDNYPWSPPKELADALDLASSACQAMTVSVGLFGVELTQSNGYLRIASSNATSLACAWVPPNGYPRQDRITLRPPVPGIIAALLRVAGDPMMDVTENGIYILGQSLVAHLPVSAPLAHDLDPVLARYNSSEHVSKINSDAVQKFLHRAKLLADKGTPFLVTISVSEGQIVLEQTSVAAASEQYFLAEGLNGVASKKFSTVALSGELMATSLSHVKEVVLDYLDTSTLVFRGDEPKFTHIIGGQAK